MEIVVQILTQLVMVSEMMKLSTLRIILLIVSMMAEIVVQILTWLVMLKMAIVMMRIPKCKYDGGDCYFNFWKWLM